MFKRHLSKSILEFNATYCHASIRSKKIPLSEEEEQDETNDEYEEESATVPEFHDETLPTTPTQSCLYRVLDIVGNLIETLSFPCLLSDNSYNKRGLQRFAISCHNEVSRPASNNVEIAAKL